MGGEKYFFYFFFYFIIWECGGMKKLEEFFWGRRDWEAGREGFYSETFFLGVLGGEES